jgi:NAD(P)-dependent dehydrogenase (short-subunit alcohol dehydrogenase family)
VPDRAPALRYQFHTPQQGATVIMACRSMEHAATAREDILADPRNAGPVPDPAGRLIPLQVDFEDFETIPKFVEAFHATGLPLHVLVNNAGVHLKPHKKVCKPGQAGRAPVS